MRNRLALTSLFILLGLVWQTMAQVAPRDYAVTNADVAFAPDQSTFTISFLVTNNGGPAVRPTDVSIVNVSAGGRVIQEDTLRILQPGEQAELSYTFTTNDFAEFETVELRIEVGIDLYELAGTAIARDNVATLNVTIPAGAPAPAPTTAPPTTGTRPPGPPLVALGDDGSVIVAGRTFTGQEVLLGLGGLLVAFVLLWLFSVILRLIFRGRPRFGVWQPAYASVPPVHTDTVEGRRQAWQMHAQNGSLLATPTEGTLHPIKLLENMQGEWLEGWRIVAARLVQYDNYGRVLRSQAIASKGWLRRANRIQKRRAHLTPDALMHQVQPLARALLKQFRGTSRNKNLFLPVALDIRWEGASGGVRIRFELYQHRAGTWQRLDEWEPHMIVVPARLQEQYTFTIHGQTGGEKRAEYFQRLQEDLRWLLAETLRDRTQRRSEAPRPHYDVPDTLAGMTPVSEGETPRSA